MKDVGQLHTQYMNRNYGRSGTLWEGRFRSCLVQAEDYLFSCYRYIELNPVRAGLAHHAYDYPWSSYRANAEGTGGRFVTPHEEYLRLGRTSEERRLAYREMFGRELPLDRIKEIRNATNGNVALGDKTFTQKVSALIGRRAERGVPGRPSQQPEHGCAQLELTELG
jgi:putative transposase